MNVDEKSVCWEQLSNYFHVIQQLNSYFNIQSISWSKAIQLLSLQCSVPFEFKLATRIRLWLRDSKNFVMNFLIKRRPRYFFGLCFVSYSSGSFELRSWIWSRRSNNKITSTLLIIRRVGIRKRVLFWRNEKTSSQQSQRDHKA